MKVLLGLVAALSISSATDLVCPEEFDPLHPSFLPHVDCTKYYVCYMQNPIEQNCPSGLHWNQQLNYCDHPSEAGCVGGTTSTTVTSTSTITTTVTEPPSSSTTTVKPVEGCPEQYDPDNAFMPHVDCTKFYQCTEDGRTIEISCPAGLHWNSVLNVCDYPELAGCVMGSSSVAATGASTECPEEYHPEHPVFLPHEQCDSFYVCFYGQAVEMQCPGDMHWNQDKGHCDPQEQAGCVAITEPTSTEETTEISSTEASSSEVPTTEAPPTETTSTQTSPTTTSTTQQPSTEAPSVECPLEESDVPVYLPHADCSKYYVCEHGRPIERDCPPGTLWNATLNVCDNPGSSGCQQE